MVSCVRFPPIEVAAIASVFTLRRWPSPSPRRALPELASNGPMKALGYGQESTVPASVVRVPKPYEYARRTSMTGSTVLHAKRIPLSTAQAKNREHHGKASSTCTQICTLTWDEMVSSRDPDPRRAKQSSWPWRRVRRGVLWNKLPLTPRGQHRKLNQHSSQHRRRSHCACPDTSPLLPGMSGFVEAGRRNPSGCYKDRNSS